MVLQKRLDYGFNGYQVPSTPRATRSARVRGSRWNKVENNQMCAFELLAAVAGKLLQEGESSPTPNNASEVRDQHAIVKDIMKPEKQDDEKPLKVEPCDQGSCDESFFVSEFRSQGKNGKCILNKFPCDKNDVDLGVASIIKNSDLIENVACTEELLIGKSRNKFEKIPSKAVKVFPGYGESPECEVGYGIERTPKAETEKEINGSVPDMYSLENRMELDRKRPMVVSSDSSVDIPICRDFTPCGSSPRCRDNVKVASRDDDENSSGCTHPSTITSKAFRSPSRTGDRRIKKLFASKYWKVAPKLKDGEHSTTDEEMKPVYHNMKACYTRQRSQRNSPFKKRKLFNQSSVSTSDGGISSEGVFASLKKGVNSDATGSGATMRGASGASSSVAGQQTSFHSRDSHVKLRIKSFKVPELFIEIPETETVGSLKRTVMEAVTAILGGGLRVGVLLQGKKVRDDNKTLLQSGISCEDKLDTLGFVLEPTPEHAPTSLCPEEPSFLLPYDTPQPLARYPATSDLDQETSDASPDSPMTKLGNCVESNHDSFSSPSNMSTEKNAPDSRALVAVPAMSVEALAVIPLHRKSRRSDIVQRRIRRPFSVSEVEALVQAVEKLGTGRWRDVKLRAFDNAKHRTYVDLKDKWKTLVHTARISPQQRRGEPVPQELLDRVLSAHAYWSQQQAKHHLKHQSEPCLLL